MNSVESLRKLRFSSLTLESKVKIKALGRPLPLLSISHSRRCNDKTVVRKFSAELYNKNDWICGCDVRNKFFCFPCLLFGDESTEAAWTKTGVNDLGHLSQKIKKHEHSKSHLYSQLEFNLLGTQDIRLHLSSAYRQAVQQKNDQMRKNRYVLSKIIDCVKFCGAFELALRGHDESSDSLNPGIFKGLINFSAELDIALKDHLASAAVFKGASKAVQNDLLRCMLEVYHKKIKNEMSNAEFVSIIVDETTDVQAVEQIVIIFRYLLPYGNPVERFWAFYNPSDHDAKSLADLLTQVLLDVTSPDKVISQSYDGASVTSGHHSGAQSLLKEQFQYAHYVHCYAHDLNFILSQAASQYAPVRIFFSDLNEIPVFFSSSFQRTAMLDEMMSRKVAQPSNTKWDFKSRTVQVVYDNLDSLIECLERIENTSPASSSIAQARGLRLKLEQPTFEFWLSLFYNIIPYVDILYNQLQKCNAEPAMFKKHIKDFETAIQKIRDMKIDKLWEEHGQMLQQTKRCRTYTDISTKIVAKQVCYTIVTQVKERFQFKGHLQSENLLIAENFEAYEKRFPHTHLHYAVEAYPFLDKSRLRTELELIYSREDFRCVTGAVSLLQFMIEHNLQTTFSETVKLLKVVTTTPMTTPETERRFSTLKRVKTFLRSAMSEETLSALAMLSIERNFINSMENFNEAVINKFAALKERRMDFKFKYPNKCEDPEEQQNIEGVMEMKLEVLEEDGNNGVPPEFQHVMIKKRSPSESEYPARKRKVTTDDDILETRSFEMLPRDEHSVYGEHIANEIRKLTSGAQNKVKHLINNIIYDAQMGLYDNQQGSTQTSPAPPFSVNVDESFPDENSELMESCTIVKEEDISD